MLDLADTSFKIVIHKALVLVFETILPLASLVPLLTSRFKNPTKWGESMRFRAALSLVTLFIVCFTVASWATADRPVPATSVPVPGNSSQSGKIASIGDAAFSLEITKGQE